MSNSRKHRTVLGAGTAVVTLLGAAALGALGGPATAGAAPTAHAVRSAPSAPSPPTLPGGYQHLVVIYEENHSFDNLYGSWGSVHGEAVDGLADSTRAQRTQVAQDGTASRRTTSPTRTCRPCRS